MTLLSERPSKNIPVVIDDNFSELEVYSVSDSFLKRRSHCILYMGLKDRDCNILGVEHKGTEMLSVQTS